MVQKNVQFSLSRREYLSDVLYVHSIDSIFSKYIAPVRSQRGSFVDRIITTTSVGRGRSRNALVHGNPKLHSSVSRLLYILIHFQ